METTQERYTKEEQKAMAQTILSQFCGGRHPNVFIMAGNIKSPIAYFDGGVQFAMKRSEFNTTGVNKVRVELTPMDVYTVKFYKIRGVDVTLVSEHTDIYAEDLPALFYRATGLYPYIGFDPRRA